MKKFIGILLLIGFATFLVPDVKAQVLKETTNTEVYQEINAFRAEHNLPPLEISKSLERSSSVYAFKVNTLRAGKFKHAEAWANRQKQPCAELLGTNYKPYDFWKKSYTHRSILLAKGFTAMGAGKSGGRYVIRFL